MLVDIKPDHQTSPTIQNHQFSTSLRDIMNCAVRNSDVVSPSAKGTVLGVKLRSSQ